MAKTLGTKKSCCELASNLVTLPGNPDKPEMTISRCTACGCRHFKLKLDTIYVGLQTKPGGNELNGIIQ